MAKGYTQIKSINHEETFLRAIRFVFIHILLATVPYLDLENGYQASISQWRMKRYIYETTY